MGGLPFAFFAKGGPRFAFTHSAAMPKRLKRLIGQSDLHFIAFCCYQRRKLLASARVRSPAVKLLEEVRASSGYLFAALSVGAGDFRKRFGRR